MRQSPYSTPIHSYALFVLLAAYQAFYLGDYLTAASSAGIALIFDPIGSEIAWKDRSTLQRGWLFLHLAAIIALIAAHFLFQPS